MCVHYVHSCLKSVPTDHLMSLAVLRQHAMKFPKVRTVEPCQGMRGDKVEIAGQLALVTRSGCWLTSPQCTLVRGVTRGAGHLESRCFWWKSHNLRVNTLVSQHPLASYLVISGILPSMGAGHLHIWSYLMVFTHVNARVSWHPAGEHVIQVGMLLSPSLEHGGMSYRSIGSPKQTGIDCWQLVRVVLAYPDFF